jgi:putative transposase
MVRRRKPPSQTWRTFLDNHVKSMVSVDFFAVQTVRFQILYVFLVLAHERRRIAPFAVTAHLACSTTARSLFLGCRTDRDRIFGWDFVEQVKAMGIQQVFSTPRSPWQRAYVERVIGSIRRECLDHMIVFNERCLYRHLQNFVNYVSIAL